MTRRQPDETERRERVFVALSLPARVVEAVSAWQRQAVSGRPGLRAVGAEALHVTLAFCGERPADQVERIAAIVSGVEPVPVPMRLLPQPVPVPRRRPRLFAFEVAGREVPELQAELAERLVAEGLLEPEARPFWPHLSAVRVRSGGGRPGRLPALPERAVPAFDAVRVALYRSELRSEGARYSTLADVDLPPRGGG